MPRRRHSGIHMDSRGPATLPRHLYATQALAWVHLALPRGLACHVASTRVPHHVSPWFMQENNPLFAILKTIKSVKSKINSEEIQKNLENSEINIFENITLFNLKFSPLANKFIHLISCQLKYKLKEGYKMNLK